MLAPFLLPSSILYCHTCDLPLLRLQTLCHQGGMRGPGSDADLGAPVDVLSPSLSSPGSCSLQHLLARERGRGCLGTEDSPPKKSRPRHACCPSICLSLGNPKSSSQPWYTLFVGLEVSPMLIHHSHSYVILPCPTAPALFPLPAPSLHLLPPSHLCWFQRHPD